MESTISIINLMPSTKEQLNTFVAKTVAEVEAGNISALQLKSQLKFVEAAFEGIDKQTRDSQLRELSRYGKEGATLGGYKIEAMEAGIKYDYTVCNDLEWNSLEADIKALQEKKKDRETFLKALSRSTAITDEFTGGETITVNHPIKTSTSSLKFTMIK